MPPINDDLTKYGSVFQTKIITSLLTDQQFAVTVYDMIQPELMGTEAKQWLVKSIKDYYYEYKVTPTLASLKVKINEITTELLKDAVVDELREKGAIFVDELSEVKDNSRPVIFSAHGVPKSVPDEAKFKNLSYVDATCPLVSKVHRESEQLHKKGYEIFLIGHKNHPEVIGTMGQLPLGSIKLIETKSDVENLQANNFKKPLAYITQTTLSVDDTAEIINALKNKFPKIKGPIKEDICYATTNRQSAVKEIASKCDLFFVVGSRNSSNSVRLVEVAKKAGC